MPKSGLITGTEVRNKATIFFDGKPLDTPKWLNTIDSTKPTSTVLTLNPTQGSPTFNVQWSGTDVGSGVLDFTILVSENGGPFTTWLQNTPNVSEVFVGRAGNTYSFFSLARDVSGNSENGNKVAEAITEVAPTSCAADVTNKVSISRGGFRFNRATGHFVQELVVRNVSHVSIPATISLVLDDLSNDIDLVSGADNTACSAPLGNPIVDINAGDDGVLRPREAATVILEFYNPTGSAITYRTRVLAGSEKR